MQRSVSLIFTLLFALSALVASGQDEEFVAGNFSASNNIALPYRLHSPLNGSDVGLPLIVYLHGSGGYGADNRQQISGGNVHGTRLWLEPNVASQNPAFVLAPQIPRPYRWGAPDSDALSLYGSVLIELIEQLTIDYAIDTDRIYLMGQSLGGMGVWDILAKRPAFFAAGIPVCGSGNSERIARARDVPIWAFHGDEDTAVPVAGTRAMVSTLRALDSDIRYTEYAGVGHNSWERAFAEPELPAWLFSKALSNRE